MKLFILFISCAIALTTASIRDHSNVDLDKKWEEFKLEYNKVYTLSREETLRKQIFTKNVLDIEEHNQRHDSGLETYEKGINQFSDLTYEEFAKQYLGENNR